jgi:hypothetical protein
MESMVPLRSAIVFIRRGEALPSDGTFHFQKFASTLWPAPGFADTELGVLMELEVAHGSPKKAAAYFAKEPT